MNTVDDIRQETAVPAITADQDGYITHVNSRFEEVFGWSKAEIVGKSLTIIIPKNLHDSHHLGFSRFLLTGKSTLLGKPLELKAVTKDGREFSAEHFILAEQRQGRWIFAARIRPVP